MSCSGAPHQQFIKVLLVYFPSQTFSTGPGNEAADGRWLQAHFCHCQTTTETPDFQCIKLDFYIFFFFFYLKKNEIILCRFALCI